MSTAFNICRIESQNQNPDSIQFYPKIANPSSSVQMCKLFRKIKNTTHHRMSEQSQNYNSCISHDKICVSASVHFSALKSRKLRNQSLQKQKSKNRLLNKMQQQFPHRTIHSDNSNKEVDMNRKKLEKVKALSELCILSQSHQLEVFHNKPKLPRKIIEQSDHNFLCKSDIKINNRKYKLKRKNPGTNNFIVSRKISLLQSIKNPMKSIDYFDSQNCTIQQHKRDMSQIGLKRRQHKVKHMRKQQTYKIEAWRQNQESLDTNYQIFC